MDNKIMMVGALVAILLVGGLLVFMSLPKNVPLENRLTGEKLVKLDGVQKVNFQNQNPLDAAKKFDLTLTACPSTGELVADASLCPVAEVPVDQAINCDGTNFAPVCTPDGHTYTNDCFARSQGANEFRPGVCQDDAEDAGAVPAAGNNACPNAGEVFDAAQGICVPGPAAPVQGGAQLTVQCANGELVADATLCPVAQQPGQPPAGAAANCNNNREPVCDVANGFTYLNSCFANAAGVAAPQAGACQSPAGQQPGQAGQPELPAGVSADNVDFPIDSGFVTVPSSGTSSSSIRVNYILGFDQELGENSLVKTSTIDKFIVMSVTLRNTGTTAIDKPLSKMKVFDSLADSVGATCDRRFPEVEASAFSSESLAAGQSRTGLIACTAADNANQVRFEYQGAKVKLFDYIASANSLVKKGTVGQKITNHHLGEDITVDSVDYYSDPAANPNVNVVYRGEEIANRCINDGTGSTNCRLVILNLTVRNSVPLPWSRSLPLKSFKLKLENEGGYLRDYDQAAQTKLDKPLDLEDMRYDEVRTGQMIFPVGAAFLDSDLHLDLIVHDKDENWRGTTEVRIQ